MAAAQAQQQQHPNGGQFGDTTYTKVFVGGLAWETQRETMRTYFEQFGEILEAVVITDKNTGRSKGYGFVTFREPEAARRACVDAAPIIDGRRANCNLASLGANRSRPSTPQHGNRFRVLSSFHTGFQGGGSGYQCAPGLAQPSPYAIQQGFPYHTYGYSPYSTDCGYSPNYYSAYGGAQFPYYAAGPGMMSSPAIYPYFQFNQPLQNTSPGYPQLQSFSMQVPHIMQFSAGGHAPTVSSLPQQYGGMISIPNAIPPTGMTLALPAGGVAAPNQLTAQHYQVFQAQYTVSGAASEQPSV